MKTLLSINNYYYLRGGAEFVFLEQNRLFEQAGWQVVPFAMQHENNLDSEYGDYFVDEIELGRDYHPLQRVRKALKAMYSFEARSKIRRLIDHVRPNIAHAHNLYHHLSPSILPVLRQSGIPTVLTLHDLKIACPAYRMMTHDGICERCKNGAFYQAYTNRCLHGSRLLSGWGAAEAYLHRLLKSYAANVTRFIVPSRFYRDKFVAWGWPEDRFDYVPNFVAAEALVPCYEPAAPFTYFGRLSSEKGLETLIRAAASVNASLQIIGTGPDTETLKALAKRLGVNADFPGFVSGESLFDRIRASRAVVLPSEWYENAPISVLEAYACGKPVIGADIGGIPELIDNERGRTFESCSSESLAATLQKFLDWPDARIAEMGEAARQYVLDAHSESTYLRNLSAVYKPLMDEGR